MFVLTYFLSKHFKFSDDKAYQASLASHEKQLKIEDLGIAEMDDKKQWQCLLCSKIISSKANAIRHFKTLHLVEEKNIQCPRCPPDAEMFSKSKVCSIDPYCRFAQI